ncbi:hypothetical protein OG302_41280 [Streptomyces sp. NBC_01283]|uniref:hypothetical protein n=1 Tax=Streptomyces sp. NBC_01283 TaxID=2903812 RepID=UPI00352CCCB8|nr:hypothetical protein OG302_41280 [Streptomyces sp. NBC_01283]
MAAHFGRRALGSYLCPPRLRSYTAAVERYLTGAGVAKSCARISAMRVNGTAGIGEIVLERREDLEGRGLAEVFSAWLWLPAMFFAPFIAVAVKWPWIKHG